MIRAILFDLGNVLVPIDFERGFAQLAARSRYSLEEVRSRIRGTDVVRRYETGETKTADFVLEFSRLVGLDVPFEEFRGMWNAIFSAECAIPEAMLRGLKKRYRMVLLSNTNELHFRFVRERFPVLGLFDGFALSHEVRAMKPAAEIYRKAVSLAGCKPGECFFTDDLRVGVEGARREGIDAEVFTSLERLQGDLRARGVDWLDA